ncbi:hypothetical protein QR680_019141 [Steinernema hermaphroditum]|uniref:Uncharacterized protein n=1 Tax=Steinernema hermaphroditum TaxID=289476 RepID=A0AA39HLE6_9BILA|nr:hypothetical protein QR680_019141 [Steinernema hermaphroditum]
MAAPKTTLLVTQHNVSVINSGEDASGMPFTMAEGSPVDLAPQERINELLQQVQGASAGMNDNLWTAKRMMSDLVTKEDALPEEVIVFWKSLFCISSTFPEEALCQCRSPRGDRRLTADVPRGVGAPLGGDPPDPPFQPERRQRGHIAPR